MKNFKVERSIALAIFSLIFIFVFSVRQCFADKRTCKAIDVGSRKQLFIDDKFIESSKGVEFVMNQPQRTGRIVLKADAPWEIEHGATIGSYSSVIKEGNKIRLWYDMRISGTVQVAYAESTDGINFTKPILGLYPSMNGSKENNIVMPTRIGGGSVWIDPKAPADKRYRSQQKGYNHPTAGRLYCYYSADGIKWTLWQYQNIGHCDTQSIAFWDNRIRRYVLYTRRNPKAGTPARYRVVRRLDSDDLENWENEVIVMQADETDNTTYKSPTPQPPVDYYGAAVFKYPDDDGLYVMLSQTFWHFKRRAPEKRWGISGKKNPRKGERLAPSTIDVHLAVSRDGRNFQCLGKRKPFLSLGPEGTFDSRIVWTIPNPVPMGDELWIYYSARNTDHDGFVDPKAPRAMSGIGLAVMRLDGFVSADADYTGGELVTPAIKFEGGRLELNVDTGAGGSLRVELQDEKGRPIAGFTEADATYLWGNSVRMPVSWGNKQDVSKLAGKPVKIRFVMRDCKLYAFQFTETP